MSASPSPRPSYPRRSASRNACYIDLSRDSDSDVDMASDDIVVRSGSSSQDAKRKRVSLAVVLV